MPPSAPLRVVTHVDTGVDDAAMLVWLAGAPEIELVATLTGWGNVGEPRATRNTAAVLAACGAAHVPVHRGLDADAAGPAPIGHGADWVMGLDGLGGVVVPDGPAAHPEPAVDALLRLAHAHPGELTLLEVAPCTTLAAALALDPGLPGLFAGFTLMGGSVGAGGNVTAAAEANVGNDPGAAAAVVEAFGAPGALAGGAVPRMVGLDVTHPGTIDAQLVAGAAASTVAGADLLHDLWAVSLPLGDLETEHPGLPVHDLLAAYAMAHPEVCTWERVPLVVDTGGGAAWGMTVADRRVTPLARAGLDADAHRAALDRMHIGPGRWDVAVGVDVAAFRAGLHRWLGGPRPPPPAVA